MNTYLIVFAVTSLLTSTLAYSEKADAPGEAEQNSTHVLTGLVTATYSRITRDASHETGHYVARVQVEGVEKGNGLNPGQFVYVRYWQHIKSLRKDVSSVGPSGHQNVPAEGQRRKMCLARHSDGLFDVSYVSGFKSAEEKNP